MERNPPIHGESDCLEVDARKHLFVAGLFDPQGGVGVRKDAVRMVAGDVALRRVQGGRFVQCDREVVHVVTPEVGVSQTWAYSAA